jgi:methylated-DNA-[protein]-cysteine S-methyltransferase
MTDRLVPPTFDPADAAAAASRFAAHAPADVVYAVLDSPIGALVAATTDRGLACLSYEDHHGGVDAVLDSLAARLSPRIVEAPARLDGVRRELDEYFDGRRREFAIELDWCLVGDGFARRVLEAAIAIPFGSTSTYRDVAGAAGSPRGFRAAGNALGSNPIPIVVPCHRVLAASGGLGGYTGGLDRKRLLLGIEGAATRPLLSRA